MKSVLVFVLLCGLAVATSFGEFTQTGVSQGKNGWLFHIAEFGAYQNEQPQDIEEKLNYIAAIAQLLKTQGTQLVVALVPAKIHLYTNQLPDGLPLTNTIKSRYERALGYLQKAGVTAVDLLTPMRQGQRLQEETVYPVYQKLDHHFSSRGALIAAKAVADTVRQVVNLAQLPRTPFILKAQSQEFYEQPSLLGRLPKVEQNKYKKEAFIPYELTQTSNQLLNKPSPAMVLVGSSASKGGRLWPFEYGIPYYLGTEVANAAQIGRGPWLPLEEYLSDLSYQQQRPKVIIWQLWEAFLLDVDQAELPEYWAARLGALIEDKSSGTALSVVSSTPTSQEIAVPSGLTALDSIVVEVSSQKLERLVVELVGVGQARKVIFRLAASNTKQRIKIPLMLEAQVPKTIRLLAGGQNLKVHRAYGYGLHPIMAGLLEPKGQQNLLQRTSRVHLTGFAEIEANGVRWAVGPETSVGFFIQQAHPIRLELDLYNPIANQEIRWYFNGQWLETWQALAAGEQRQRQWTLQPVLGKNTLKMMVKHHNGFGSDFAQDDPRQLSVMFNRFEIGF